MSSQWGMVDGLLRELGSLRSDAQTLDSAAVGEAVIAEVDRLITDAAEAVDGTIVGPESESLVVRACEAIVAARARIGALTATATRSWELIGRGVELRRQAARLLYDRIRGRD
ncbi:MAG TPA: hypothetical protein VGQ33_00795 [Vicinamibacteria bacterium]|jgi:hypothetical protein|nr:hypothetical protein [Vicinamibacteria bacterium]